MSSSPAHSDSHGTHVFAGLAGLAGAHLGARSPGIRLNEDLLALAIKLLLANEASIEQLPELLHAL